MKNNKPKTYTLLNSDITKYSYEYYVQCCEANDIEPVEEDSSEFWDWCAQEARYDYDASKDNLAACKLKDRLFAVTGKLGLWWGQPDIVQQTCKGLLECIEKCNGRDINDIEAVLDTVAGCVTVRAFHHDGTNVYNLWLLNKNGERWARNAEERYEDININSHWYTKIKSINQIF